MGAYGDVAVKAAQYISDKITSRQAWEIASCEVFSKGSASQLKSCPKNTFLGLYGGSGKNALYAQQAVAYLKANPNVDINEKELWNIIMHGESKAYNHQMDVVLSLYQSKLLSMEKF